MKLSRRLATIAALVPDGARACDIGTDHAYLPIALRQSGKAQTVIAADVNEKPLSNARKNIAVSGMSGVETRLCDGLSGITKEEVDTVIIAGIGGEVIAGILAGCDWLCLSPCPLLILQPTTSPEILRRFLCERGFSFLEEVPVEENGKVYSVFSCRYTGEIPQKKDCFYYIGLLSADTAAGRRYIQKQYDRLRASVQALEKSETKKEEHLYYQRICEDLESCLSENDHAI